MESNADVGSVWLRGDRARRSEPPLSRARIVDAAVELLDEQGAERLTMRRLAERLGAGAPTLYWHVATKDDVLDLAVDAIFGEPALPAPGERWRDDVTALLAGWRQVMLRHPWSAELPSRRRPLLGPHFLAWMELLQAALVRAGLHGHPLHAATWALYNHVVGAASAQASLRLSDVEREVGQRRLDERRDAFPTLAEHGYLLDDRWDDDFTTGLEYLLAGIAAAVGPDERSGQQQ